MHQHRHPWLVTRVAAAGGRRRALCSTPRLLSDQLEGAGSGEVAHTSWTPNSQRCGALAVKCGMMSLFDGYGVRRTVTIMMLDDLQVTQVKCQPHDEVTALQVGIGSKRAHKVPNSVRKHFEHNALPVKQKVGQFTVTPDALMPVGTPITARHFVPGQHVDVQVCASPVASIAPSCRAHVCVRCLLLWPGPVEGQGLYRRHEALRFQGRASEPRLVEVSPQAWVDRADRAGKGAQGAEDGGSARRQKRDRVQPPGVQD